MNTKITQYSIGGFQAHQLWRNDGICSALTAAAGMGGGYIPCILIKEEINMRYYEDECVGCPPELGCMGSACPNRNVEHIVCDECGDELGCDDEVTTAMDGKEYCAGCYHRLFGEDDE